MLLHAERMGYEQQSGTCVRGNVQVYDIAIDTIILAFCEDCDANDGHPKHAPALLMEALGYSREAHQLQGPGRHHASESNQQFIESGQLPGYGAA